MSDDCVVVCFYNGKKIRIYYLPYNSIEAEASLSSAYIVLSEKLKTILNSTTSFSTMSSVTSVTAIMLSNNYSTTGKML